MPKNKKLEESDDDSSGPEDRTPAKKAKGESSTSSSKSKGKDGDEHSWELEKKRFVKVRQFKGQTYIDIREFYEADGDLKPGKKGISLTARQWQKLKEIMPEVDEVLKEI